MERISCLGNIDTYIRTRHPFSSRHGFLLIILAFIVYFATYSAYNRLPTPKLIEDENIAGEFIAERSQNILRKLTNLGPRVVGSKVNEVLAVKLLIEEIENIIRSSKYPRKISYEVQVTSGSYYLHFQPIGAVNSYANVQNVIVKLDADSNKSSLLINAHFDSVPTSPGGSDDGIMCATMLEALRVLTSEPAVLERPIVFLFNGAEETPLHAAHGFTTQHRWAKQSKVVINLEAAGSGGREILFQSGPSAPWLLNYYRAVPHPHGQSAGEELFESKVIPSDTDFRLFRDFGDKIGYDFAFARNGYRYHTKYDNFDSIPLGSFQNVGDNLLALIHAVTKAPEFDQKHNASVEYVVYYDFLGLFMVSYGSMVNRIIEVSTIAMSTILLYLAYQDFGKGMVARNILLSFLSVIVGTVLCALYVFIIASLLDWQRMTMVWYGNPILISVWYCIPIFTIQMASLLFMNAFLKQNLSPSVKAQISCHAIRQMYCVVLLIGMIFKIKSGYTLYIPLVFNILAFSVIQSYKLQYTVTRWIYVYLIISIISVMFIFYQFLMIFAVFIPITGRIGSDKNPELIIGGLALVLTSAVSFFAVGLIHVIKRPFHFLRILFFLSLILATIGTLGLSRYSGDDAAPTPQRFWIFHTSRTFHGKNQSVLQRDNGIFLLNMDRNSPFSVQSYVDDLARSRSVENDCDQALVCGLPLISPRMLTIARKSTWIPTEPIITDERQPRTQLKLDRMEELVTNIRRYHFTATGAGYMNVYISLRHNATLEAISMLPAGEKVPSSGLWNGRDIYFVNHVDAKMDLPATLQFYIDILLPEGSAHVIEGEIIDIAITGKYIDRALYTPEFEHFLSKFPRWADVTSSLAMYESYLF